MTERTTTVTVDDRDYEVDFEITNWGDNGNNWDDDGWPPEIEIQRVYFDGEEIEPPATVREEIERAIVENPDNFAEPDTYGDWEE